jgi:hypothetical protein
MHVRATFRCGGLILMAGALLAASALPSRALAGPDKGTAEELKPLRTLLQQQCADNKELQGVLVLAIHKDAKRCALNCLIEQPEQADLLKAKAEAFLAKNPFWGKQFPDGVVIARKHVFPLVDRLQAEFAESDQPILHSTRLDRAYFQYTKDGGLELFLEGFHLYKGQAEPKGREVELAQHTTKAYRKVAPAIPELEAAVVNSAGIRRGRQPILDLQRQVVDDLKLQKVVIVTAHYDEKGILQCEGFVNQAQRDAVLDALKPLFAARLKGDLSVRAQKDGSPGWSLQRLIAVPWSVGKERLQAECAASDKPILRHTRLDQVAYGHSEDGDLELIVKGVSCYKGLFKKGSTAKLDLTQYLTRLYKDAVGKMSGSLGKDVDLADLARNRRLRDALRAAVVRTDEVASVRPRTDALRKAVAQDSDLDGVRIDEGGHFNAEGQFCLRGLWVGEKQSGPLRKLVAEVFKNQKNPLDAEGICFDDLTKVDTAKILLELRKWTAANKEIEEVWIGRLYFKPDGKGEPVLVFEGDGPDGKSLPTFEAKVLAELNRMIKAHPERELLEKKTVEDELPAPREDKEVSLAVLMSVFLLAEGGAEGQLTPRPSLTRELRHRVQGRPEPPWAGVLIERGYYDEKGQYGIRGLVDRAEQNDLLSDLLKEIFGEEEWRGHLLKGRLPVKLAVLPLEPMLRELRDVMPEYAELDGVRFVGAYHEKAEPFRLVLTGYEVKGIRGEGAGGKVKQLLIEDDKWQRRATGGVHLALEELERKVSVAELAVQRTAELLRQSLPDSLNPVCTGTVPVLLHPYKQERQRFLGSIPAEVAEKSLEYLNTALMHNPMDDTAAWFLRAMNHMSRGESRLAARDLRRLAILEADRPYLREGRLAKLEMLQGVLRIVVADYADHVTIEASAGRMPLRLVDVRVESSWGKTKLLTARR